MNESISWSIEAFEKCHFFAKLHYICYRNPKLSLPFFLFSNISKLHLDAQKHKHLSYGLLKASTVATSHPNIFPHLQAYQHIRSLALSNTSIAHTH